MSACLSRSSSWLYRFPALTFSSPPFVSLSLCPSPQFVKTDNCNKPGGFTEQELYANFSAALNATGRPILFSLCEWGEADVIDWGGQVGQAFRIQEDHLPFWEFPSTGAGTGFGQGTSDIIEYVASLKPSNYKQRVRLRSRVRCTSLAGHAIMVAPTPLPG